MPFSRVAIVTKKLQGGYTSDKVRDFVTKYSTLATFFRDFFQLLRHMFMVATSAIFTVR